MKASLRNAATKAREWLFDAAFPFWFDKGIDHVHGGFVDLVGTDGSAIRTAPKRTFVQARQVYAFAAAGRLGWPGQWRSAIETGLETIDQCCRHDGGGFIHRLNPDNTPDEGRRDLYDQAFVAFAKAHAANALADGNLVEEARLIFRELDRAWSRGPVGYWEGELPDGSYRRQNPHMHLFEAALAIYQTRWSTAGDLARANRLSTWLADYFVDTRDHVLPEVFTSDWQPILDAEVFVVEPGHHFEWVWLLGVLSASGGLAHEAIMEGLWRFARRHGVDTVRNVVVDGLDRQGRVTSARARLWPQTERIRASIMRVRAEPTRERLAEIVEAFEGLQPFLAAPIAGAFHDKMSPDGTFQAEPARASSLYHIVGAYEELFRFTERMEARTSR